MSTKQKVTLYCKSAFGIKKYEGKLIEHGTSPYAQYENAPYVVFIPKGKRNPRKFREGYKPFFLILAGWEHPEPDSALVDTEPTASGIMVARSRYASFDDSWQRDFNAMIEPYIADPNINVIADYRTKGEE